jgi:predicted HTH domain antitoxin
MSVTFDLPPEIETGLRQAIGDLDQAAKEAALVELYRQRKLTHHELSRALGLSRFEVDALLKRRGVAYDVTLEQVKRESASLGQTDQR